MLDCNRNYKMRGGMTHKLEVEREGNMSDHGCNYKRRVETTYVLDVERRATCHVAVTTTE